MKMCVYSLIIVSYLKHVTIHLNQIHEEILKNMRKLHLHTLFHAPSSQQHQTSLMDVSHTL